MEPDEFESELHALAVKGPDEEIYPHLNVHHRPNHLKSSGGEQVCSSIIIQDRLERPVDARPLDLPLYRQDLLDFRAYLAKAKGKYTVPWATKFEHKYRARRYTDDLRGVVAYRTAEFMVRPRRAIQPGGGQPRTLHIGWRDICDCLELALDHNAAPDSNPAPGSDPAPGPYTQVAAKMGTGTADNASHVVQFEWRIDRALQTDVDNQVKEWKYSLYGGCKNYTRKQNAYDVRLSRKYLHEDPSNQPLEPGPRPRGRPRMKRSQRSSASPEPGPSRKRQSVSSQSATSSPEESRASSLAGSAPGDMPPPPRPPVHRQMGAGGPALPPNLPQEQTPIGSPGSVFSGSSYSGESGQSFGMSSMGIQSPNLAYEQPNPGYPQQAPGHGEPALGYRQPPREYGDDLEPPMVFSRTTFGPRQTFRPETRAPVEFVHYQPQPGFAQGGRGSMPNPQAMPPGTRAPMPPPSGAHGPPGSSTSTSQPTEGNVEFERAMRQAMAEEQRSRGHPETPYQGSQTDSQSDWTDDGSEDPRGPYYTGGGYPSGSQGSYRGGGGHYRG